MKFKKLLLTTFLEKEKIEWYVEYLNIQHAIPKDKVFAYENITDGGVIVTFFIFTKDKVNLSSFPFRTIILHKKQGCFYTINSLNLLIEKESGMDSGNIVYSNYKIDWSKYSDKIILITDKKLSISDIKRIFL